MPADLPALSQEVLLRYCHHSRAAHYSPATLKSYQGAFRQFLVYHAPRLPLALTRQDVLDYLAAQAAAGTSQTYQNLLINAINFYYEQVENQPRQRYGVPRPRLPRPAPQVLTKKEVSALLRAVTNLRHRALLLLAYGLGLRPGELLALTPQDIDEQHLTLHVRGSRNKQPRHLPLPGNLLPLLRDLMQQYRPITFLFEGQVPGQPYGERGLQLMVRQAAVRAGIRRPVTVQMLRHSYATHLLEAGADIRLVQRLLGHANLKATEVYTRVARPGLPASPLSSLDL